jgi:hypothetical protein
MALILFELMITGTPAKLKQLSIKPVTNHIFCQIARWRSYLQHLWGNTTDQYHARYTAMPTTLVEPFAVWVFNGKGKESLRYKLTCLPSPAPPTCRQETPPHC